MALAEFAHMELARDWPTIRLSGEVIDCKIRPLGRNGSWLLSGLHRLLSYLNIGRFYDPSPLLDFRLEQGRYFGGRRQLGLDPGGT